MPSIELLGDCVDVGQFRKVRRVGKLACADDTIELGLSALLDLGIHG
jgi:hypothetical protein